MRKLLLAAVLALATPTTSQAIVSLGLRFGVGLPAGYVYKDSLYKDGISSQIPIQLDVMFGAPRLQFGLYVGYGVDNINTNTLNAGESAKAATLRAGLQVTGEFLDLGLVGLWGGLGTGYESIQFVLDTPTDSVRTTLRGWEFATLSVGADLKFIQLVNVGLYGSAGLGQFGAGTVENSAGSSAGGLGPNKAIHSMFTIGLRGTLNL